MSRLYFSFIILLVAGILVAGIAITANSLEDLGGKSMTVWAVNSESGHAKVNLLGTEYDISLSQIRESTLPTDFILKNGLRRAVLWFKTFQ